MLINICVAVLHAVLAQHLEYLPGGSGIPEETQCAFVEDQREALGLAGGVAAVVPDILLAKMRPGQCLELEAHCVKGGCRPPVLPLPSLPLCKLTLFPQGRRTIAHALVIPSTGPPSLMPAGDLEF